MTIPAIRHTLASIDVTPAPSTGVTSTPWPPPRPLSSPTDLTTTHRAPHPITALFLL